MSAYKERQSVIAQLLSDLMLTDVERAEIAGCSTKTVQRVRAKLGGEPDNEHRVPQSNEPILQQYQRHLREQVPVGRCVEELRKLAFEGEHSPTKLAALKRLQELQGVVTAKETKQVEETRPPGPMLIFPSDSRPVLVVKPGQPGQTHSLDRQSSALEAIDAEAVEVADDDE